VSYKLYAPETSVFILYSIVLSFVETWITKCLFLTKELKTVTLFQTKHFRNTPFRHISVLSISLIAFYRGIFTLFIYSLSSAELFPFPSGVNKTSLGRKLKKEGLRRPLFRAFIEISSPRIFLRIEENFKLSLSIHHQISRVLADSRWFSARSNLLKFSWESTKVQVTALDSPQTLIYSRGIQSHSSVLSTSSVNQLKFSRDLRPFSGLLFFFSEWL